MAEASTGPRRHTQRTGFAAAALLAALWAAPLLLLGMSLNGAKHEQRLSTTGASGGLTTVGSREIDDRRAVVITASSGATPTAYVDVPGTVTAVMVGPGDTVATGTEVVSVDGRRLWALQGDTPLYRDLRVGDSGDDVRALGHLLVALDVLDAGSADDSYGIRYHEAVQRFQHTAHYLEDGVFRPSYVIFVPADFGEVTEVNLRVGQRIAEQTQAVTGTAPIVSIGIKAVDAGVLPPSAGGGYALRIGSESVALSRLPVPGEEIPGAWSAIAAGIARGDISSSIIESDAGSQTEVGGAQLAAATRHTLGSVPAPAVFTTGGGASCLFVAKPGSAGNVFAAARVAVSADSGEFGLALVDAELIGERVARDPSGLPRETLSRCT